MTKNNTQLIDFFKIHSYKKAVILLFVILALQALFYKHWSIFKQPAISSHAWRQADCLSFAYCFYDGSGSFWEPAVNNIGGSAKGKCASDFPLIQYIVGKIWHITGVTPIVFRLITLLITFLGLFHVFKLFNLLFKNNYFLSIALTTLLFTSPLLAYYSVSVVSDIHGLSFSFIGIYYWFSWLETKKRRDLFWVIIAFSLAGLFKLSAGLSFFVCLFIGFIRFVSSSDVFFLKRIGVKQLGNVLLLMIPFVAWFVWYRHASLYNEAHPTGFFLIGILPYWKPYYPNVTQIEIFRKMLFHTLPQTTVSVSFYALIVLFTLVTSFTNFKKYKNELLVVYACVFFFLLFIVLFYQVLPQHDYYFTNLTALLLLAVVSVLSILFRSEFKEYVFTSRASSVTAIILVLFFTYKAAMFTRGKYKLDLNEMSFKAVVFNEEEAKFFNWMEYSDDITFKAIGHRRFSADKVGIKKDDVVLCLGDYTINRSLFLLKRKGYTNYNLGNDQNLSSFLADSGNADIDYVVVLDRKFLMDTALVKYLDKKVYDSNGTSIYKVDLKK